MDAAWADRPADLHVHSTCSDGLLEPSAVVREAAAAGIGVLSLTDHDTVDGIAEATAEARARGLLLVPGVELTCRRPTRGTLHLLGYGIDPGCARLEAALGDARRERSRRLEQIVDRLRAEGLRLDADAVRRRAGKAPAGRPHVADVLVASGQASSRAEAFARWLGDGRPGDVPRVSPTPESGIELIHAAGGLAVLAHPPRPSAGLIESLARAGLDGVEVLHPSHAAEHVKILRDVAARFGLLQTGGSDCHGDRRGLVELRAARVPAAVGRSLVERLEARAVAGRSGRS
jgi:predicted metal-dependent phosphoesterase TrpH